MIVGNALGSLCKESDVLGRRYVVTSWKYFFNLPFILQSCLGVIYTRIIVNT